MRRGYFIALIIICTLAVALILQFLQYPIKIDRSSMEIELQKFEEREDIKVQKIQEVNNRIIILYTYENGAGYGIFNKGYNGRCLLASSDKNTNGITFLEGKIKTNKGEYDFFAGKNFVNMISSIEFTLEAGNKLRYDISNDDYFILTERSSTKTVSLYNYDLLNERGNSIKDEIVEKYLSKNFSLQGRAKADLEVFNLMYVLLILISGSLIYQSSKVKSKNNISN